MIFTINGNGAKLTIDVLTRCYPDCKDFWDGNWLNANIKVSLPGYQASFNGDIRADEVNSFLKDCKKMTQTLSGFLEFSSIENILKLKGEINKTGQIKWSGQTTYPVGLGDTLTFEFLSDQTFLPSLIAELESVMKEFPVIGKL